SSSSSSPVKLPNGGLGVLLTCARRAHSAARAPRPSSSSSSSSLSSLSSSSSSSSFSSSSADEQQAAIEAAHFAVVTEALEVLSLACNSALNQNALLSMVNNPYPLDRVLFLVIPIHPTRFISLFSA